MFFKVNVSPEELSVVVPPEELSSEESDEEQQTQILCDDEMDEVFGSEPSQVK